MTSALRLAMLPERQRLVVFMRYYADLEYSEIAAALGIQVGRCPRFARGARRPAHCTGGGEA